MLIEKNRSLLISVWCLMGLSFFSFHGLAGYADMISIVTNELLHDFKKLLEYGRIHFKVT